MLLKWTLKLIHSGKLKVTNKSNMHVIKTDRICLIYPILIHIKWFLFIYLFILAMYWLLSFMYLLMDYRIYCLEFPGALGNMHYLQHDSQ